MVKRRGSPARKNRMKQTDADPATCQAPGLDPFKLGTAVNISLNNYQRSQLNTLSLNQGTSMSALIREAVDAWLLDEQSQTKLIRGRYGLLIRDLVRAKDFKAVIKQFRAYLNWPSFLVTALYWACKQGQTDFALNCLKEGVDGTAEEGMCFKEACAQGLLEIVEALLLNHSFDRETLSAGLVKAVQSGHDEVTKLILKQGVSLKGVEDALYWAASEGYAVLLEDLLRAGLNPGKADELAPLEAALRKGHLNAVKVLLNYVLYSGASLYQALATASRYGSLEMVLLLLRYGAPLNYQGASDPLFAAVSRKAYEVIDLLLEKGAEPREGNLRSCRVAIQNNDTHALKRLLKAKTETGFEKHMGSLLIEGAGSGSLRTLQYLMKLIQDKEYCVYTGTDFIEAAVKGNHKKVVEWAIETGFDLCALEVAVYANDIEIFKLLLEHGEHKNGDCYISCFLDAVELGHRGIMEYFINLRHDAVYICARQALNLAVRKGNSELVQSLLGFLSGSEPDSRANGFDENPLCLAVKTFDLDIVKYILNAKPGLVYVNLAREIARENGFTEALDLLENQT